MAIPNTARLVKIDDVLFIEKIPSTSSSITFKGTLQLLTHHLLFSGIQHPPTNDPLKKELLVWYSTIKTVDRKFPTQGLYPLYIFGRNFISMKLFLPRELDANQVYTSLQRSMNIASVEQLFAFHYKTSDEVKASGQWFVFDPEKEFGRQGITDKWRLSRINEDYQFASTYPAIFAVPSRISDNVLRHIGKFRSKSRIPALSYFHKHNQTSITRSSQPMVGLKQNRSIQDEKLVEAIFAATDATPSKNHLIIDARPTANALAQTAMGGGTESADVYKGSRILFLGIDNIHVVRDSQNKLIEALQSYQEGTIPRSALDKSGWLKHIKNIIEGTLVIVQNMHIHQGNVLVHCSDGWDRTAQLCSLAGLCLDPYYRTIDGFLVLVEKEWCSFGFKFSDRCGHLSKPSGIQSGEDGSSYLSSASTTSVREKIEVGSKNVGKLFSAGMKSLFKTSNEMLSQPSSSTTPSYEASHQTSEKSKVNTLAPREVSPIFTQFLDCVYQLWIQFPTHFEFNDTFLLALNTHIYSGQFGNFLFNCERERKQFVCKETVGCVGKSLIESTCSLWDWISTRKESFINPVYVKQGERKMDTGEGAGVIGRVDGSTGTMSPDGTILFPSTHHLRYWASLFLRKDEELNYLEPFPTSASSHSLNRSSGITEPVTVGDLMEEKLNWAMKTASTLVKNIGSTVSGTNGSIDESLNETTTKEPKEPEMATMEHLENESEPVFKLSNSDESLQEPTRKPSLKLEKQVSLNETFKEIELGTLDSNSHSSSKIH